MAVSQDRYFLTKAALFFRWEDDAQALIWDNGVTIAFRQELAAVMRRLAPECLPPWTAIAVLMSACRDNWPDGRALLAKCVREPESTEVFDTTSNWEGPLLGQILDELDTIHELPLELRHSLTAKAELAAMVFEVQIGIFDEDEALRIAAKVEDGLPPELRAEGGFLDNLSLLAEQDHSVAATQRGTSLTLQHQSEQATLDLVRELRWLRGHLAGIDGDELRRRIKTGIEQEVVAEPEEIPPSARELINQLLNDEKLGGIARVAQQMLSLVTFPRRLSEPQELPLGGVSDISNRGQLDKLLLSELAYDDTTLAIRVANNEAMYLRRESPPAPRSCQRQVLIDSGVTMWGIPRLFAISSAMAIQAAADDNTQLSLWSSDEEPIAVDVSTRAGLEDQLARLSAELQPSESLRRLTEQRAADSSDSDSELVVITSGEAAATPEFRHQLELTSAANTVFLLTVSRAGDLEFSECSFRGRRTIRTARLELDHLLQIDKLKSDVTLKREGTPADFPAVLSMVEFPLRMACQLDPTVVFSSQSGPCSVTPDGQVLLWDHTVCGGRLSGNELGKGKLLWSGFDDQQVPIAVYGRLKAGGLKVLRVELDGRLAVTTLQTKEPPVSVAGHRGLIFVIYRDSVEAFVRNSERPMHAVSIPKRLRYGPPTQRKIDVMTSSVNRFFAHGRERFALGIGSDGLEFQTLGKMPATHFFDRQGQGIVSVHNGTVTKLWSKESSKLPFAHFVGASADGSRFLVASDQYRMMHPKVFATDTLQEVSFKGAAAWALTDFASVPNGGKSIRNRIRAVGFSADRMLLRTPKGVVLNVIVDELVLRNSVGHYVDRLVSFAETQSPPTAMYRLSVAKFENGSRVFLDSRGFLHLVGADGDQATLLLCDGRLNGWTASGGYFGTAFFDPEGKGTSQKDDRIHVGPILNELFRTFSAGSR